MTQSKWWERFPEMLQREEEALRKAGVVFHRDRKALEAGVMKFILDWALDGEPVRLEVTFPDLYPYFRFEVAAPEVNLLHHQNPWQKNLCLMGRDTQKWNTTDTVASLLDQVKKVFETGRATDKAAVADLEQHQAEPIGEYYPYAPATILIQSDWIIPEEEGVGTLTLGLPPNQKIEEPHFLQAAVLQVRNRWGQELARLNPQLAATYNGQRLEARWVRSDKPISVFDPQRFFEAAKQLDPQRARPWSPSLGDGNLYVYGVLFPEEVDWRADGRGWVFICRHEWVRYVVGGKRNLITQPARGKGGNAGAREPHVLPYFARAGRVGLQDVRARTPELLPLSSKVVAQFGLGCLGAPSALEFARAGVGELRVLDGDTVDPGTVCRWPIGLSAVGRRKVDVITDHIHRDYPYTKVVAVAHHLGAVGIDRPPGEQTDEQAIQKMTEGAHLIYDATGEVGVGHYLSDLARKTGIPYVAVTGSRGGWGGTVVRIVPNRTDGCWFCYRTHVWGEKKTIPEPPFDPDTKRGEVQPIGCAAPTFVGAGFDLVQVASSSIRAAVSTLCGPYPQGYPDTDWDVLVISFRTKEGAAIAPHFQEYKIEKHPKCRYCNPS